MSKLSEKKIIELFQSKLGNASFVPEDVESFKIGKEYLIVKVDTFVQSTDLPPQMKLEDAARKSIVSCVSDFAAKGVKPIFGIVSITIPKKLSRSSIQNLAKGLQRGAREFELKILGGDTNEGKELVITFSLFGTTKKIVSRSGAKTGHVIITSGSFGYTGAGLSILLKNKKSSKKFRTKAKNAVFKPKCKLLFGLKNKKHLSSSMDSSDGLSTTLNEMSDQSKKKFVITRMPSENDILEFAISNKLDPNDLILNGGEEYEIVATTSKSNLTKVKNNARKHRIKLYEIGYVTKGSGVFYKKNGKFIRIKDGGWKHLED